MLKGGGLNLKRDGLKLRGVDSCSRGWTQAQGGWIHAPSQPIQIQLKSQPTQIVSPLFQLQFMNNAVSPLKKLDKFKHENLEFLFYF
jgi:hypothetical protein